jgi:tRNA1(Val) A37 N6-methylase TrmN6
VGDRRPNVPWTEDAVLGGRLRLRQPRNGHRVGHDAILLAAAVPARAGDHAVDLGAGVGAAGLALASRVDGVKVTLVEIDPALVALAGENIRLNGLGDRAAALMLDVTAPARAFAAAGLRPGSADLVVMNPPFRHPGRAQASPVAARRRAHVGAAGSLAAWCKTAGRLLRPRGRLTLIWPADGLAEVLKALAPTFGGMRILPIHPKPGRPALRVIVAAVKASRAPLELLPGLFLTDDQDRPSAAAEGILREGKPLPAGDGGRLAKR